MHASRLVAILLHLQSRGRTTAPQLAAELEVSVRTIYRDVAALQAAGAPLWTETGPKGGIRLIEGWRTDLDGLTTAEAAALFVGGPPAVVDQLGLGPVLAAAQVKVLATLPAPAARAAADARARFLLDAPAWFAREEGTAALPDLAEAVWADRRIDVRYQRDGRTVARRLDPLGLVLKGGTWYLVARHGNTRRTYRVSRIASVRVRPDRFERPAAFDLAGEWAEAATEFDRSLQRASITVRVSPHAQRLLPTVVPSVATREALAAAGPPDRHGWRVVDLAVESEAVAHGQLLGLGAGVEVLHPPSLRRALAATARELADRNGAPGPTDWTTPPIARKARPR